MNGLHNNLQKTILNIKTNRKIHMWQPLSGGRLSNSSLIADGAIIFDEKKKA